MALSDTSFFSNYQNYLGISYARGVDANINPYSTYTNLINARQALLASLSSTDVSTGLTIINTELANETSFASATSNITKTSISATNTFYTNTNPYNKPLRDVFPSLTSTNTVYWTNNFKEAFYQSVGAELIQLVGFVTFTGTTGYFVPFVDATTAAGSWNPNKNNITVSASGKQITITDSSFTGFISDYGLANYGVLTYTGSFPSGSVAIGNTQTITGIANSNTFNLSSAATGNKAFFYRPIKNSELLEFRLGGSSISGAAATSLLGTVNLTVGLANTSVLTSATAGTTRIPIYINNTNTVFKSATVGSVSIDTPENLGTQRVLEVWVKSSTPGS